MSKGLVFGRKSFSVRLLVLIAGVAVLLLSAMGLFLNEPPASPVLEGAPDVSDSGERAAPDPTDPSRGAPVAANAGPVDPPRVETTRVEEKTLTPRERAQARLAALQGRVVLLDGTPAAGAQLILRRTISSAPYARRLGIAVHPGTLIGTLALTTADEEGRFTFSDLPAGRGYQVAAQGNWAAALSGLVQLLPGRTATLPSLVVLPAGRVVGMVRNGSGAPVAGATVDLVTTGSDGRFDLGYRSQGPSKLRLWAPRRNTTWTPISVVAGQVTEVELALEDARGFDGVIRDPDGLPIPTARIDVSSSGELAETVVSDRDGGFRVLAIEPQDVAQIQVEAIGYHPVAVRGPIGSSWDATLRPSSVIHLRTFDQDRNPQNVQGIEVCALPGDDLPVQSWMHLDGPGRYRVGVSRHGSFVVTAEAPRNGSATTQVAFAAGSPDTVAEIVFGVGAVLEVQLMSAGGARMVGEWIDLLEVGSSPRGLTAQTSDIGEAVFRGLRPGTYQVEPRGFPSESKAVRIAAERALERVRLTLPPFGSVTIHPTARSGDPLPLRLTLEGGGGDREAWSHGGEPVRFDRLAPGEYAVRVDGQPFPFSTAALEPEWVGPEGAADDVVLARAREDRDYELSFDGRAPGSLRFAVVADGRPVAGADLWFTRHGAQVSGDRFRTGADGVVALPQVGCGSYALRADLPGIGGPLDGGRFEIVPGVETARSLVIRTGTLSGHVARASDGVAVEGASIALVVRIDDGDSYFMGTGSITETDEEGRFELPGIPIQSYRVEVTAEGVSTRITATPGGPPIELRL